MHYREFRELCRFERSPGLFFKMFKVIDMSLWGFVTEIIEFCDHLIQFIEGILLFWSLKWNIVTKGKRKKFVFNSKGK